MRARSFLVYSVLLGYIGLGFAEPPPPYPYPYPRPPGYATPDNQSNQSNQSNQPGMVLQVDTKTQQEINKFFDKALYKNFKKNDDQTFTDNTS